MKVKQKFIVPIYGLRKSLTKNIKLGKNLLLRNINLLEENDWFKEYGLNGDYKVILEVDYEYDPKDPDEPVPAVFLNIINLFDASLVVFGDGRVGVAAIIPDPKTEGYPGGQILFSGKIRYKETLKKEIDEDFKRYYEKFLRAYESRPVAFDVFRRSQERFANNDRTIDSCIVLESIFVPLGSRLKKPFILNGMKIMGFNPDEVASIDDLIEYRNALIHADRKKQLKLLSGTKYTHKWFENVFSLVRRILKKYVGNPWY